MQLNKEINEQLNRELVELALESWDETFRLAQKYANKREAIIKRYNEPREDKKKQK